MSERLQIRDILWWLAMTAFIAGAMTVPRYPTTSPILSRLGVAIALSVVAWRLRWLFHRRPISD